MYWSTSAVSWKLGLGRPWVGVIAHAWGNFLAGNSSTGMFFIFPREWMKKKEKKLIDENLFNLNEMCSLQKKVE